MHEYITAYAEPMFFFVYNNFAYKHGYSNSI